MPCCYPNCLSPSNVCLICNYEFCQGHLLYHPCRVTCLHPQCHKRSVAYHTPGCTKAFCEDHIDPTKHACLKCHHFFTGYKSTCKSAPKAMCPHCRLAYCEAHLKDHEIYNPHTSFALTPPCTDNRRGYSKPVYEKNSPMCTHHDCQSTETTICVTCFKHHCSAHHTHNSVVLHEFSGTISCYAYKSAKKRDILLGKIPAWSFVNCSVNLGYPGRIRTLNFEYSFQPIVLDMADDYPVWSVDLTESQLFSNAFAEIAKDPEVENNIAKFTNICRRCGPTKISIAESLQILKKAGSLGPLYSAFLKSSSAKNVASQTLEVFLQMIQEMDLAAQAAILRQLQTEKNASLADFLPEEEQDKKNWSTQVVKLSHSVAEDLSAFENIEFRVCILDMTANNACWIKAMSAMKVIRNLVNARYLKTRRTVWHISMLEFEECQVFAVNHKNLGGKGTTRILFPITKTLEILKKDKSEHSDSKIRVLDLSYGELESIVCQKLVPKFKNKYTEGNGDRSLAASMIGVLENDSEEIEYLKVIRIKLGARRCAFLKGIKLNPEEPVQLEYEFDKIWWLSKKSFQSIDLDALGVEVTAYEVICNVLAILFIAEPRHALAMYPATLLQLKEVAEGNLTFDDLFGCANGRIQNGRLLPGANNLREVLANQEVTTKFLAQNTFNQIVREINPNINQVLNPIITCPLKSFAMPLADFSLFNFDMDKAELFSPQLPSALANANFAQSAVFEPAMKVLFTIFLRAISAGSVLRCEHSVQRVPRTPLNYKIIAAEDEQQDLIGEDDNYKDAV
jgi:hypothetical protein